MDVDMLESSQSGSNVRKMFEGHGWLDGVIVSYDKAEGLYTVIFEDGDEEEYCTEELKKILLPFSEKYQPIDPTLMAPKEGKQTRKVNVGDQHVSGKSCEDLNEESLPVLEVMALLNCRPQTPKARVVRAVITPSHSKKSSIEGLNPRSVAMRGLPCGALARCPKSGLTIRAMENVAPIVRPNSIAIPGLVSPPKRKQKEARELTSDLPCRLLLVDIGENDAFQKNHVGKTFNSASELHATLRDESRGARALFGGIATYQMEVVADPAFATWEFTHARMVSAGLVQTSDEDGKGPYVVRVHWDGTHGCRVSGEVCWYKGFELDYASKDSLRWAFIEGDEKEVPDVLIGATPELVDHQNHESRPVAGMGPLQDDVFEECENIDVAENGNDILPRLSSKVSRLRLPASLLQKAIRRGDGLSSPSPLLEACKALLTTKPFVPGSTLAMLKTVWSCMLVDASPFDDGHECLGLPGLLLLSLVAKANPLWSLPECLREAAVTAALRTATSMPSQPWVGFVRRSDDWWCLEESLSNASRHRNILRATQAVVGGRVAWGRWDKFVGDTSAAAALAYLNYYEWKGMPLPEGTAQPCVEESRVVAAWRKGGSLGLSSDERLIHLDMECRLSAIDSNLMPSSLVALQAILEKPPTSWKKHGLPSLSKQVRKLISEANPRYRERVQLARLATWGKEQSSSPEVAVGQAASMVTQKQGELYKSFRQVVTPTGTLSEKETEVVDCFEAVQQWQYSCLEEDEKESNHSNTPEIPKVISTAFHGVGSKSRRIQAGPSLTEYDGRIAFLLAFASAMEIEVFLDPQTFSKSEVVSTMFSGDSTAPLLVQRIGKARKEGKEPATAGGATSGATAVPSLGYIQRNRSTEEARLMEATEIAVAEHWKGGKTMPLPLPPPWMQWELNGMEECAAPRTIDFVPNGNGKKTWRFTIAGIEVKPFDARVVVSPCALDLGDPQYRPIPVIPGSDMDRLLRIALYVDEKNKGTALARGKTVLKAMAELHVLAELDRTSDTRGLSEGLIYDWLPLTHKSLLPSRTWRDALLAIRTREKDHVLLGRGVRSDGTGAPRDMTEGVLLRLFHGLEMLYPTALKKEGAMKFRVRPRGAAYHHLLVCLEHLGRGDTHVGQPVRGADCRGRKREHAQPKDDTEFIAKRPRRTAAITASQKASSMIAAAESSSDTESSRCAVKIEIGEENEDKISSHGEERLPVPRIKTALWNHQEASVAKVLAGVRDGKRGHADASAVGAGKTLTALAAIVRLAQWIEESDRTRHGVLVMLPTKALIREWLLEIATHTEGFHVIEQREDGTLFSLTYAKSHPPIDGNSIIISTLDRVCRHPFVRQAAWDFVVIDECLSIQNAAAKRNPSAWRQIEVSMCGVLMLSATFFRSKYDQLFYMIRMLRSPLPRTMEWLPATIHEHIICQIPETDRSWQMQGEMVPMPEPELRKYRSMIESFRRMQINDRNTVDGRKLWVDLESFLRKTYEGRATKSTYRQSSVMSDAFAQAAETMLRKGRKPLIFADTSNEGDFLLRALQAKGINACSWASVTSHQRLMVSKTEKATSKNENRVIVAVKTVEGQGINMQHYADAILCRPTPGDHLEQMKGRIDRPGQRTKKLLLVVVMAEHTIEEAKFANIRLAGNFFREYIAPVATKYRERIDLEAALAAGGTQKLKRGTVSGTWKRSLEAAGQSGAFADFDDNIGSTSSRAESISAPPYTKLDKTVKEEKASGAPKCKPLNKVPRNKGDPEAARQAKMLAKSGQASLAVRNWLFYSKTAAVAAKKGRRKGEPKPLGKDSLLRFSDATPPVVLDRKTVHKAVTHLSKNDPRLGALIARVGADALANDCGTLKPPTQARLFDRCLRAITFTMVSVDAGNAFLRRLTMKIGACLEQRPNESRQKLLDKFLQSLKESNDKQHVANTKEMMHIFLSGDHQSLTFTHGMLRELVDDCEVTAGKQSGYPHLCGVTFPCGKNDDHSLFLAKARAHAEGETTEPVSAGFSRDKAGFLIALVKDFEDGKISGEKIAKASDREAAKMLIELKGIGDWCAGGVLMHFLSRADVMLYGDLTVRNYLNDLYDINHHDESETLLESAADFADNGPNRNLIDKVTEENGWSPYRSVVCLLMYHLQEENLVLF